VKWENPVATARHDFAALKLEKSSKTINIVSF
jgi:hypothetical protein